MIQIVSEIRSGQGGFQTDNPIEEMGIKQDVIAAPISQMVKDCLADTGMDNKSMLKCRNMFALGLVCWLFNRDLAVAENFCARNLQRSRK